jgi:multidrug resistance efflux pump
MQELKKMQAELITAQTQKQEHWAQIEPLQEQVAEVLAQVEEARTQTTQTWLEFIGMMSKEVVA